MRHWPALALGNVSVAGGVGLALWHMRCGGPDLFPLSPVLSLTGTVVLVFWVRRVQREMRDLPENCRACQQGGRCPVHGEDDPIAPHLERWRSDRKP